MTIPLIFENCSDKYSESFLQFANCSETHDPCSNLQEWNEIENSITYGILLVPAIIALIHLALNIYIFVVSISNFKNIHEDLQKRYIYLISKTISIILLSSAISIESIYMLNSNLSFWTLLIFIFWTEVSFISFVGTYISASFSTYIAIVRPLFYRKYITIKMTLIGTGLNWTISALCAALIATIQSAFVIQNSPIKCDYKHCYYPILILLFTQVVFTFLCAFLTILFSIISLYRHQRRSEQLNDVSNTETIQIIIRRMISSLIFLLFAAVFETAIAAVLIPNAISIQLFNFNDNCAMFYQSDKYLKFIIIVAVYVNLWTAGILLDTVSSLFCDPLILKWPRKHIKKISNMLTVRKKSDSQETSKETLSTTINNTIEYS